MRPDLSSVTTREPLGDVTEAFSGARLERVQLADGRTLVLKHLPPEGDWLTRATDGRDRTTRLWNDGLLDRIRPLTDHTVLDVRTVDGHEVVVMRDAAPDLLPGDVPVSLDVTRELLSRLAALHDAFAGERLDGYCSIGARYAMFSPASHASDEGPGSHPVADRIVAGWEIFFEQADREVARAVRAVHDDPARIGRRLGDFPTTLLHGDAKLENLGLNEDGLVAIDWGELTGFGPREVEVGWFALKAAGRVDGTPDDLFAQYEAASGTSLRPEALDLVAIGCLAQMGFRFALGASGHGFEPAEVARAHLDWWTDRVGAALGRVDPL